MNGRKQTSLNFLTVVSVAAGLALCAALACAQDNATPAPTAQPVGASSPVPRLIKFSGFVSPPNSAEQNDGKTAQPTTVTSARAEAVLRLRFHI